MGGPDPANFEPFDVLFWLNAHEPGARNLSEGEITSVIHFALLRSLFEAHVCGKSASAPCFRKRVQEWSDAGVLRLKPFHLYLKYFQNRYLTDGEVNDRFARLRLRNKADREEVVAVLKGENGSPGDIMMTVLFIVYRYRNNLFHGEKWVYALAEQADNFDIANRVLADALEMHKNAERNPQKA